MNRLDTVRTWVVAYVIVLCVGLANLPGRHATPPSAPVPLSGATSTRPHMENTQRYPYWTPTGQVLYLTRTERMKLNASP